MSIIHVNRAELIQPALDSLQAEGAAGTPSVVVLEDGGTYNVGPLTIPQGVTLRGGSQTSTLLIGTVTLSGFLESLRMVGMVKVIPPQAPGAAAMRKVIVAQLGTGPEPTLEISQDPAGGGAFRAYGCTFVSSGTNVFRHNGMPEGATSGMIEVIFDESCRFESYHLTGTGAVVDMVTGGTLLAYFKGAMFLSSSSDVDYLRANGQNVEIHGGGLRPRTALTTKPKIVQSGLGVVEVWNLSGLVAANTVGNVTIAG